MARLILASTSAARRTLLARVGLEFEAVSPGIDEPHGPSLAPADVARALALAKARAVFGRHPDAIVIGADQVVAFEGRCFSKAADLSEARENLRRMSGKEHVLLSAVAVVDASGETAFVEEARLTLRTLSLDERERYLATGEWEGCAGGYRIEGRGLALLERIDGEHTTILGLPMPRLLTVLASRGVRIL